MTFVIDASVVLAWALEEVHATAAISLERIENDDAVVPALWWFEVRNGLIVNERRERITATDTARFLQRLARFAVHVDAGRVENNVLAHARRHCLTVYDAAHLELAQRRGIPLATLDRPLASAARAEQVALIGE